jgi:hypothetical protein
MKRQLILVFAALCATAQAQQPIGSVAVQDAVVAGDLTVNNGRAVLVANTTITAKDRTANVTLNRGGSVLVCATSGLRITSGKSATGATPLMLSLNRGAIEVRMPATANDVVMTPDLRFAVHANGPLDLRLRVAADGDTCVENRGKDAPTLNIVDQFGESSYDLRPGQHVLFEHGSLKEVVDNESSPCGCPPARVDQGVSLADAVIMPGSSAPGKEAAKKSAEEQHPFPAAVSDGLAPPAAVPQTPSGVVHAQVATTLSYSPGKEEKADASAAPIMEAAQPSTTSATANQSRQAADSPSQSAEATAAKASPSPASPPDKDLAHWIGHFFKRLFGRH